jgi:hypothetical protein
MAPKLLIPTLADSYAVWNNQLPARVRLSFLRCTTSTCCLSLSPEIVSLVSFNLQFPSSYNHQLQGYKEEMQPITNPEDLQT